MARPAILSGRSLSASRMGGLFRCGTDPAQSGTGEPGLAATGFSGASSHHQ